MPKTKEEIIKIFSRVRPNYSNLIDNLNDEDYLIVESLVEDDNFHLVGKVVSYIGLLKTEKALSGIVIAARSQKASTRAVAAHALRNFTNFPKAISLINDLLDDPDLGVRKFALKTVDIAKVVTLKEKVRQVSERESNMRMKRFSVTVKDSLEKFENSNVIIR